MKIKKETGDDGHRSHCLSHAKQALYHLSYTPDLLNWFHKIICLIILDLYYWPNLI